MKDHSHEGDATKLRKYEILHILPEYILQLMTLLMALNIIINFSTK